MKIYDFLTSKDMVEYWLELNKNSDISIGGTLFPSERVLGTKLEWVRGANNQPVGLRLSAYDSKSIRRDREGIKEVSTKMPFFKESMYIDEEMRQNLNNLIAGGNTALINSVLSRIFNDQTKLISAAEITLERMRMEALTTGTITLASNGQGYTYDYGLETHQKQTVTTSWSDPAADVIGDIENYKSIMKAKGVTITRALCNSSVVEDLKKNTAMKDAIYVFAGGSVNLTSARVLSYLESETGLSIAVNDNVYVNDDGTAVKYVPDDTFVMLPDGALGKTNMGTTPEESDLMNSLTADVSMAGEGIAVTNMKQNDPVTVETKVSMVAFPSFERANEILIVDTAK